MTAKEIRTVEFVVLPSARAKAQKMFQITGACRYVWNHFREKNLAKVSRKIANIRKDWIHKTIREIADKCGRLIEVNPAYTSQACSHCGQAEKENRKSQARFQCVSCGFGSNADTAINIRRLGMAQLHGEECSGSRQTPVNREIDMRQPDG